MRKQISWTFLFLVFAVFLVSGQAGCSEKQVAEEVEEQKVAEEAVTETSAEADAEETPIEKTSEDQEFDKIVGDSCSDSPDCSSIECGEEDGIILSPFCKFGRCWCILKGVENFSPPCDDDTHCKVFGEEECYADEGEVASCEEIYPGKMGCECVVK